MTKYHVNSKGEPGLCRAKVECPFGGDESHYSSKKEAARVYENEMFVKTEYKDFKYNLAKNNTSMHTDITEGGTQVLVLLMNEGVDVSGIDSTRKLANSVSRLPNTTKNFDKLQEMSGKLYNLPEGVEASAVGKLNESKVLSNTIFNLLQKENFSKEDISSKFRWMGKEDATKTAGDLGLDDFEISVKAAGSPSLGNTTSKGNSGRIGYFGDGGIFEDENIVEVEKKILKVSGEYLGKKIKESSDGMSWTAIVNNKERTWRIKESDNGEKYLVYEKQGKTWNIPVKSLKDLDEWKKLNKEQQQALSSFITGHEQELKKNTDYGDLIVERTRIVSELITDSYKKLSSNKQKYGLGSFMSLKPGKTCAYVSVQKGKVKTAVIPSMEDFAESDDYRINDAVPLRDGVLVTVLNDKNKEFSTVHLRGRYRDGQLVYAGASITSEYQKTNAALKKTNPDKLKELEDKGYTFKPVVDSVFKQTEV